MNKNNVFVLVHSPLVGPLTWSLVADQLRQRNTDVIVPNLVDSPKSNEPYWKQHVDSVARELSDLPRDAFLTLVAHSGAGPLLPVIREALPNPVNAYVFVDAGLPQAGASRLQMMQSESSDWAKQFQEWKGGCQGLIGGGGREIGRASCRERV